MAKRGNEATGRIRGTSNARESREETEKGKEGRGSGKEERKEGEKRGGKTKGTENVVDEGRISGE